MRFAPWCRWRRACCWQSDEASARLSVGRRAVHQVASLRTAADSARCCRAGVGARTPIDCRGWKAVVAESQSPRYDRDDRTRMAAPVGRRADVSYRRRGWTWEGITAHGGWNSHREISSTPDGDGDPSRNYRHWRGCRVHKQVGRRTLDDAPTRADFRPGHSDAAPRRGGRDRQTWPRIGDSATASRTQQRTADGCWPSAG